MLRGRDLNKPGASKECARELHCPLNRAVLEY